MKYEDDTPNSPIIKSITGNTYKYINGHWVLYELKEQNSNKTMFGLPYKAPISKKEFLEHKAIEEAQALFDEFEKEWAKTHTKGETNE